MASAAAAAIIAAPASRAALAPPASAIGMTRAAPAVAPRPPAAVSHGTTRRALRASNRSAIATQKPRSTAACSCLTTIIATTAEVRAPSRWARSSAGRITAPDAASTISVRRRSRWSLSAPTSASVTATSRLDAAITPPRKRGPNEARNQASAALAASWAPAPAKARTSAAWRAVGSWAWAIMGDAS